MDKDNLIYNAVLAVCSNKITAEDAAKQLYLKHNISKRGFLGWCLPTYRCMLSGEIVKGQIKQSLRRVFLEGIYNDFGKLGLSSALLCYYRFLDRYRSLVS